MGLLDFVLGKKSESWYHNQLRELLSRRVSHEHKIRNAKAGLKSFGQEKLLTGGYSESQLREELNKVKQRVESMKGKVDILTSERMRALELAVEVMQSQRELLNDVDVHIDSLVKEMKKYGYMIPTDIMKEIKRDHPSMNSAVMAHISEIAVSR